MTISSCNVMYSNAFYERIYSNAKLTYPILNYSLYNFYANHRIEINELNFQLLKEIETNTWLFETIFLVMIITSKLLSSS